MTAYATSAELETWLGSSNVTATATATLAAGAVSVLTIGAGGGYGYTTTPNVVIAAPTAGTRATATATIANGVVSVLTITGAGSGYGVTAPAVTIDPPVDYDRLLDRASELIDDFTRTAVYDADDDGLPTDADVIAAFRDATCAQVEFWLAGDEDDDIQGPVQGVGLGGMQVQFGAGDNRITPLELAPRAARILRLNGLFDRDPVIL